jgi:hypothetical protein
MINFQTDDDGEEQINLSVAHTSCVPVFLKKAQLFLESERLQKDKISGTGVPPVLPGNVLVWENGAVIS